MEGQRASPASKYVPRLRTLGTKSVSCTTHEETECEYALVKAFVVAMAPAASPRTSRHHRPASTRGHTTTRTQGAHLSPSTLSPLEYVNNKQLGSDTPSGPNMFQRSDPLSWTTSTFDKDDRFGNWKHLLSFPTHWRLFATPGWYSRQRKQYMNQMAREQQAIVRPWTSVSHRGLRLQGDRKLLTDTAQHSTQHSESIDIDKVKYTVSKEKLMDNETKEPHDCSKTRTFISNTRSAPAFVSTSRSLSSKERDHLHSQYRCRSPSGPKPGTCHSQERHTPRPDIGPVRGEEAELKGKRVRNALNERKSPILQQKPNDSPRPEGAQSLEGGTMLERSNKSISLTVFLPQIRSQ